MHCIYELAPMSILNLRNIGVQRRVVNFRAIFFEAKRIIVVRERPEDPEQAWPCGAECQNLLCNN